MATDCHDAHRRPTCCPKAFPSAELIDGEPLLRRVRRVKSARGGRRDPRLGPHRRAGAGRGRRRRSRPASPSGSSPACSWRPWRRRASPPRRRRTWRGSPRASTRGAAPSRDAPVAAGRPGGLRGRRDPRRLRRRARPDARGGRRRRHRPPSWPSAASELWDRLLAACRVGAPLTGSPRRLRRRRDPTAAHAGGARARARVRPSSRDARAARDGRRAARRGGHGAGADRLRLEGRRRRRSTARNRSSSRRPGPSRSRRHPFRDARSPARDRSRYPPAEEIILYEKDPSTRIATITLNRPDQLNIPTIAARRRYADLLFKASIDDDVKVLVVRGVGDHLGTGADLDELMAKQARPASRCRRSSGSTTTTTSPCPTPRSYRAGASLLHWYGNTRSGCRTPPGLQEDQHPRGQGLLLRLALLPGGRRRPRDLVRRRALRASRLPLRRLRAAHVAVGDDDGDAQVPGDGVHGPALHGRADVRLQLREQRRAPRGARGGGGEVRAAPAPARGRPTPCSCRRCSSR